MYRFRLLAAASTLCLAALATEAAWAADAPKEVSEVVVTGAP